MDDHQVLTDEDYAQLLAFRDGIRAFFAWSDRQAHQVGITAPQHQLLLAIRGHDGSPTVGDVADHLRLRHHSVVGLVDRAELAGLVERDASDADRRVVRLRLTADGDAKLAALAAAHLEELGRLSGSSGRLWSGIAQASLPLDAPP